MADIRSVCIPQGCRERITSFFVYWNQLDTQTRVIRHSDFTAWLLQ
jgi:hypothetical protein